MFIHFKEEETRKINEVSPGRGVSGYSMYSVLIKGAETSSPLSRAPAVSTSPHAAIISSALKTWPSISCVSNIKSVMVYKLPTTIVVLLSYHTIY